MRNYLTASLTLLFTLITNNAFAAAFQLYELGTPIIGTAGVGQAAVANDASTAYFNPAGMTLLVNSNFMLGTQAILPYYNFSRNARTTIFPGDNGGNAGTLIPGSDLYYVYNYNPSLKFGISLTSPYGGLLNYNDGWVGRYIVQDLQFYTLNLNPSIAYRFNNCFALGAGIAVEYANLEETLAFPLLDRIDGQANLKLDNTNYGFNVGILYTPSLSTKIGVAYRSRINHHFTGDTTFLRINATPSTTSQMIMPNNVIASLEQDLTDRFSVLAEFGWANWRTMQSTIVNIRDFSSTIPRDWHDTYRVGLGGKYNLNPELLLEAGASYDSSPTSASHRTPDLPMDRQVRIGAGLIYTMMHAVQLGFSYEYINFGPANIHNHSSVGDLFGSYSRNFANVFQASINVSC